MTESNDDRARDDEESREKKALKDVVVEKAGALSPGDSVKVAGDRMRSKDTNVWPVADDRKLVGVVDERNPDRSIAGHGHDPQQWRVGEIMKRDAVFCYEDEDSEVARQLMEDRGLRHIPVVDREMRIVGIFSIGEVSEAAGKQDGGTVGSAGEKESSPPADPAP